MMRRLLLIACITMLIDHIAFVFEPQLSSVSPWLYVICRTIGRLAFPLFAFCITEGAVKTSSPGKYIGRVALFALIAQIPYSLMLAVRIGPNNGTKIITLFGQSAALYRGLSVMVTLLLGLIACLSVKKNKPVYAALALAAAYLIDNSIGMDYGFLGVVFILALYLSRASKAGLVLTMVLFAACFHSKALIDFGYSLVKGHVFITKGVLFFAAMAFAAVPVLLYNGRKGPSAKLAVYCFYPAHMLALWAVNLLINK